MNGASHDAHNSSKMFITVSTANMLSNALQRRDSCNTGITSKNNQTSTTTSPGNLPDNDTTNPNLLPRVQYNVFYIVSCTIFDESGENVLLVQEAKLSCRGKYYLPAGKMEPDETIVQAVQREVKEEAGVGVEVISLVSIQEQGARWLRFNFIGRVGNQAQLKSVPDSESLCAEWIPVSNFYDLNKRNRCEHFARRIRCHDIVPIIVDAHCIFQQLLPSKKFYHVLPSSTFKYSKISIRLVLMHGTRSFVATAKQPFVLPELVIPIRPTVEQPISERIVQYIGTFIGSWEANFKRTLQLQGVLGIEHSGRSGCDGMRVDLLFKLGHVEGRVIPPLLGDKFIWVRQEGPDELVDTVLAADNYLPAFQCLL